MRKGHGTKIDAIFSELNVTFVKMQEGLKYPMSPTQARIDVYCSKLCTLTVQVCSLLL